MTILPLLLFITLFMGKRAIGELPVFDFLVIITLASVVGADIADPDIHHFPTVVAIIAIGFLQKFVSHLKLAHRKIGRLLTFEPTVVIHDGKLLNQNLKEIGFSIDNILQMLRDKEVFDISEVDIAIIEATGALSVLKKNEKRTLTREDINLTGLTSAISYPLIVERKIHLSVLHALQLDEEWLYEQLRLRQINSITDIFYASLNAAKELHISLYNKLLINIPPIKH
ncbi:hypothetical protein JCM21714_3086 [Gracilibacillus boraciitolerans JCM 21714]|uniref:YetF C-terminal domain-containing protein n=1 Tax=Gracilibacillus boraciitolerans JCM 21714 TaxID=1298598 RepID=W4VMK3_9BACI|nr:hypothetical protein JCM21714_3086 [Gracilibacillus boraciitolerans JCM 21714]